MFFYQTKSEVCNKKKVKLLSGKKTFHFCFFFFYTVLHTVAVKPSIQVDISHLFLA